MFSSVIVFISKVGIFDFFLRLLIVLLPFTTIITVFSKERLGIAGIGFFKEILLLWLFWALLWNLRKKKIELKSSKIDLLLWLYIVSMLWITLFTTGIPGTIFGGRYDFSFLLMFWVVYHGRWLLYENLSYYLKLFLISSGVMLFLSALIKFPLSEDVLLYFGYSWNPSNWQFSSEPPIFHGIDGANVRRFQWILDGPNTMWAFLIFYMWIWSYYFRSYKQWYFVQGCFIAGFILMILATYSRSALLGTVIALSFAIISSLPFLYKKYKKQTISLIFLALTFLSLLTFHYSGRLDAIIGRAGSTKWHFERMTVGLDRIKSAPWWQWLWSAGPAYRHVNKLAGTSRELIEKEDKFYIPESWYIQQFIEWGIIGWVLFLIIMAYLWFSLYKKHIFLASMFTGIAVMNMFLHTFESNFFSLLLFLILALILSPYAPRSHKK